MSGAVWGEVANAALQIGSAYLNYDQQRQANLTNIRLARERNAFEERMSNTAIQRRAADIEAAGGNRALAFTNGSEATTPVVSAPTVEAPHFDAPRFNTAVLLQKAQMQNIAADTGVKNEQRRLLDAQAIETRARTLNWLNTGQKTQQETANLAIINKKLDAELAGVLNRNQLQQIQLIVAQSTQSDLIRKIKSGAIIEQLGIENAATKAKVAEALRGILEMTEQGWAEIGNAITPFKEK